MTSIEKITLLSSGCLTKKDFKIMEKFIEKRDFSSMAQLVSSEIIKEIRRRDGDAKDSERYCALLDLKEIVGKFNFVIEEEEEEFD